MKTLFFFFALSLLILYSCSGQKPEPEFQIVHSDNNTVIVPNGSMYRHLFTEDIYYNFDTEKLITDIFVLKDVVEQERSDYKQNKVKSVKMILDYGKDSVKKDFAKFKINRNGYIEEYIPIYSEFYKSPLKFIYDDASRLIEIVGTYSDNKTEFSYYRFLYNDKQLQQLTKGKGSQFPEEYNFTYSGKNNQFVFISGYNIPGEYYFHYSGDFNEQNKLTGLFSISGLEDSRIYYYPNAGENTLGENINDTIKFSKGYSTEYYIIRSNRIIQKIFVSEEFTAKRTVPQDIYETINYTYSKDNLLENIESSVRAFPTFNLQFTYTFYDE